MSCRAEAAQRFKGCGLGQEVIVLEYEPYLAVAYLGTLVFPHTSYGNTVEIVFSGGRCVKTSQSVEEGGFAGSGSTHYCDELTFVDRE